MKRKNTNLELVEELTARNHDGAYTALIEKCQRYFYHDALSPIAEPKVQLVKDLKAFPELSDIRLDVLCCEYDESDNSEGEIKGIEVSLIN